MRDTNTYVLKTSQSDEAKQRFLWGNQGKAESNTSLLLIATPLQHTHKYSAHTLGP